MLLYSLHMDINIPSFPILFSLFPFVLLLIIILIKRTQTSNTTFKLPPGPWKLPLVGNLHQLVGSLPHHALRDLSKKHGPLMFLKFGQVPMLVVSSPELAKEVLKTHDAIFAFRPRILISDIMFYNSTDIAFSPSGEYWKNLRKICTQELLSPARVQSFRRIREDEVFSFMEWIALNVESSINLSKRISSTNYGITSRAAFGKKSKGLEEFILIVIEAMWILGGFDLADLFPSLKFLDPILLGTRAKLESLYQRADRIYEDIIKDHKEKKIKEKVGGNEVTEDLVDVLLKFNDTDHLGFSLTVDNVKAVIWDIFSAGSETSASTLNWAMSELIRNPEIMKKAQDEVREVFSTKGSVNETAISDMKYLKSVVKETLRLHPPVPLLLPRESREKCEINGYEIPEKTRVLVNTFAIGRDPRYWTEPESFTPERFLDSAIDYKGRNFEYLPFGAGKRICPGMLFGLINVELPLAMLLYHFDWELPNGMKPQDLDMTESFGVVVGRKHDLNLVPKAYDISSLLKSE